MSKSSTKDKIINMLKRRKKMTVAEFAERLNITPMAVRRHLHTLERNGLINAELKRQTMGRPLHVYTLSDQGEGLFPNQYENLSLDILWELEAMNGRDSVYELLLRRKNRTKDRYKEEIDDLPFSQKLTKLAKLQEEKGYMVEVEDDQDGSFLFRQYHCPIMKVAENYQNVCLQEVELFKEVLDAEEVSGEDCLVSGADCCTFKIRYKE